MVENQHQQMKTYRDLTEDEIDTINNVKEMEETVASLFHGLKLVDSYDKRWLNIDRTHLQEGFSALVRAVAQPDNPLED